MGETGVEASKGKGIRHAVMNDARCKLRQRATVQTQKEGRCYEMICSKKSKKQTRTSKFCTGTVLVSKRRRSVGHLAVDSGWSSGLGTVLMSLVEVVMVVVVAR